MTNNKFVFVAPAYNAANTVAQTLLSLLAQSYNNWKIIIIDDMSTDGTVDAIKILKHQFNLGERLELIVNTEKKWEVANVLNGISHAADSDIICRIDCDDYLSDNDALRILNLAYNESGAEAIWTNHRWFDERQITNYNISAPLPDNCDVYKHPWVSSHLKTARKYLWNNINDENYRGANGNYIKRAGDQAIYLPVLHKARKRMHLPICLYAYKCDLRPHTFTTDDAKYQAQEAEFIRKRGFVP